VLGAAGHPPSACVGCPFRSDHRWREPLDHHPQVWSDAVGFDRAIRAGHLQPTGKAQLRGQAFLHASLVPLDQVDLPAPKDHGQLSLLDGFRAGCHGVCGT
jgi:hypothetical protein